MAKSVVISGAVIDVRGDNKQLLRSVKQNSRAFEKQRRQLAASRKSYARHNAAAKGVSLSLKRMGVAAVAASAAFLAAAKSAAAKGAKLKELSLQTGTTVGFLQRLARAAESDGIAFTQFTKAIQKLNTNTGEAQRGLSTYKDAFEALGIEVNSAGFRALNSEERFLLVANRLGAITEKSKQASIQSAIFGQRLAGLIVVAQRGEGDLGKYLDTFRRFGEITDEQAIKLKDLDQRFTDLGFTIEQAFLETTAEHGRLIEEVLKGMIETLPKALNLFKNFASAMKSVADQIVRIAESTAEFVQTVQNFFGKVKEVGKETLTGSFADKEQRNARKKIEEEDRIRQKKIDVIRADPTTPVNRRKAAAAAEREAREKAKKEVVIVKEEVAKIPKIIKVAIEPPTAEEIEEMDKIVARWNAAGRSAGIFNSTATNPRQGAAPLRGASAIPLALRPREDARYNTNVEAQQEANNHEQEVALEKQERRMNDIKNIADDIGNSLASSFGNFLTEGGKALDLVKDIGKSILEGIVRQLLITPLTNAISGGITGLFPGAAHGGHHTGATIVGEQGKELVHFGRQAEVVTNERLRTAFAGGRGGRADGIVNNINITSVDPSGVKAAVYELIPQMEAAIKNSMRRDMTRPGGFRDAIGG